MHKGKRPVVAQSVWRSMSSLSEGSGFSGGRGGRKGRAIGTNVYNVDRSRRAGERKFAGGMRRTKSTIKHAGSLFSDYPFLHIANILSHCSRNKFLQYIPTKNRCRIYARSKNSSLPLFPFQIFRTQDNIDRSQFSDVVPFFALESLCKVAHRHTSDRPTRR